MKKYFIISILIISAFVNNTMLYAQNEEPLTEYEKKRLEVAGKFLQKIITQNSSSGLEEIGHIMLLEKMLEEKDMSNPRASMESIEEIIAQLCGVTAFVPGEDYEEKVYLSNFRYICEEYATELKKLDKTISPKDLAFEKKKVKDRAMTNNIEMQIRTDFIVWNKKGEYEKTVDYEKRLQENSVWVFDSICQNAIVERWKDNLGYHLYEYDADNEILPMKLYYSDKDGNELCAVMYNISVAPDYAKDLKERPFNSSSGIKSEGVYKNYLFPIELGLYAEKYTDYNKWTQVYCPCTVTTKGVEPLVIKFDNLKLDNKYLAGAEREASDKKWRQLWENLTDSINILGYQLTQHPSYDKFNKNKIKPAKSLYYNSNTQKFKTFTGRVGNVTPYNWINPSQEAYEEYLKIIHLFFDEIIKSLNIYLSEEEEYQRKRNIMINTLNIYKE